VLQATQDTAVVRELELIEEQLASTWKNQDCTGWGALLADDWSVTHLDGQVITKDQAIEMCRTGPPVTSSVNQLAVRSYGDTAIVTGRTKATVSGAAAVTLRFTDVFVRHQWTLDCSCLARNAVSRVMVSRLYPLHASA
jgi:Domain of unknown function (DUF4440)